jgi:hypothetical protein
MEFYQQEGYLKIMQVKPPLLLRGKNFTARTTLPKSREYTLIIVKKVLLSLGTALPKVGKALLSL